MNSFHFPCKFNHPLPQEDFATLQRLTDISPREITASWSDPAYHLVQTIVHANPLSVINHVPLRLSICAFISGYAPGSTKNYHSLARQKIVAKLGDARGRHGDEDLLALSIIAGVDYQNAVDYIIPFLDLTDSLYPSCPAENIGSEFGKYMLTIADHLFHTLHEPDYLPSTMRHYLDSRICETIDRFAGFEACRYYEDCRLPGEKDFLARFYHCFVVLRKLLNEQLHIQAYEVFHSPRPKASVLTFIRDCLNDAPASTIQHLIEGEFSKAAGIVLSGEDPNAEWGRILSAFASLLYRQFCSTLVVALDGSSTSSAFSDGLRGFLESVQLVFDRFTDGQRVLDNGCQILPYS